MAAVLSAAPEMSASLACFAGVLGEPDSAGAPALTLAVDSAAACEVLLANVTAILAAAVALRPLDLPPAFSEAARARAAALLRAGSAQVQAGAMALVAALLAAAPVPPIEPLAVLDALWVALAERSTLQHPQAAQQQATGGGGGSGEGPWWEQLVSLLQALLDAAPTCSAGSQIISGAAGVALQALPLAAASGAAGAATHQLCQMYRDAVAAQPAALEHHVPQLLQLLAGFAGSGGLGTAGSACSEQLCHTLLLYLGQFSPGQVQEALAAAAGKGGVQSEVRR